MNTLGLGKLDVFDLGVSYGGAAPAVVNDLVQETVTGITWDIIVDLEGPEMKRADYDKFKGVTKL